MPGVPYLPPAHHWDIYDSYFDWDVNQRLIIKNTARNSKTIDTQYSVQFEFSHLNKRSTIVAQ